MGEVYEIWHFMICHTSSCGQELDNTGGGNYDRTLLPWSNVQNMILVHLCPNLKL